MRKTNEEKRGRKRKESRNQRRGCEDGNKVRRCCVAGFKDGGRCQKPKDVVTSSS